DGPSPELPEGSSVIVDAPQVVRAADAGPRRGARKERRECAVERQDLEAVPRQLELADDLRPQQAHHVRRNREAEPWDDLLGHGGPAATVRRLEAEGARAAACERGGRDKPIVATADHDGVVLATGHRGEG